MEFNYSDWHDERRDNAVITFSIAYGDGSSVSVIEPQLSDCWHEQMLEMFARFCEAQGYVGVHERLDVARDG